MNGSSVFARQASTCAESYQYYRCSKGPFEGCCAVDPCDNGICREEDLPPPSSDDDSQSQTTTLMTTKTMTSATSVTSTTVLGIDQDQTRTWGSMQTTVVTSAGSSVVATETVGVPTSTTVYTESSNAVDGVATATSSSHKGAIIGSAIGGVMGGIVLFLSLYLWHRKRKTTKISTSFENHEKEVRKRGSAGLQVNSEYTSSSSWTGLFEHYNDKHISPSRQHVNRTPSSILSELDSSPISPLTRVPRTVTSSDTIFELDSVNNHKHELEHTHTQGLSSEKLTFPIRSTSSRYSEHGNRSNYSWNAAAEPDISRVSSDSNGGIRLASAANSSTKSDTNLGRHR